MQAEPSVASHGGPELLERKLKVWCLQGMHDSCKSRAQHIDLDDWTDLESLPTLSAMETAGPEQFAVHTPEVVQPAAKKRRA